ncbi:MAG: hypothetical protein CR967_02965 [Proteobacteria bacterium]|nr:MAG: hypothetical protein CR967_02965 [Pseudomonadota bacterium]
MKKFTKIFFIFILCVFANGSDLNLDKIKSQAQKNHKNVMMFFHIDGCRFCHTMLDENFKDKKILDYIKKNFILIDINISQKMQIKQNNLIFSQKKFAKKYEIFSYPSTIFLDENLNIIYLDIGYKNPNEFLILLKFIKSKRYKKINFEDFFSEAEFIDE